MTFGGLPKVDSSGQSSRAHTAINMPPEVDQGIKASRSPLKLNDIQRPAARNWLMRLGDWMHSLNGSAKSGSTISYGWHAKELGYKGGQPPVSTRVSNWFKGLFSASPK